MSQFSLNIRRVLIGAGLIVLVLMVIDFNRRIENLNTLNKQAGIRQVQATQAIQTEAALETQVAFASSTEAVNAWAHAEGHYVQNGDVSVVPIGQPGSEPITSVDPTPQPTPMPNWQVWWNLFFGE